MKIPVVLKDGRERHVVKEELQFLIVTKQVLFFKRESGWVVVGRDIMRTCRQEYKGAERRHYCKFSRGYWY